MTASVICYNTKLIPKVVAIVLQMEQENPFTLTVMSVMVMWLIKQLCPHKHPMWFMRSIGQGCLIMPLIPGVVVWLGGVEKGGGGEGESSVQLFNNWRNSRALENSLKEKERWRKRFTDPESLLHIKLSGTLFAPLPYPESLWRLPPSESLCGCMRVWTALSKSFLQKQRCSWAIGSAGENQEGNNLITACSRHSSTYF